MATVASWGTFTFVSPVNNTEPINIFGISVEANGPSLTTEKWNYVGQQGDFIKTLFTTGQSATVTGFLDAEDMVLLQAQVDAFAQAVLDKTESDLKQEDVVLLTGALLTSAVWGSTTGYCLRVQRTFKMTFETAL